MNVKLIEFDVISATFDDKSIAFDSTLTESNAGEITAASGKIESASDEIEADSVSSSVACIGECAGKWGITYCSSPR